VARSAHCDVERFRPVALDARDLVEFSTLLPTRRYAFAQPTAYLGDPRREVRREPNARAEQAEGTALATSLPR
jgi:hypothetical protein